MKTLFAKSHVFRAARYRILTKIIELDSGCKQVIKYSTNQYSNSHLDRIANLYLKYKDSITSTNVSLVKLIRRTHNSLIFNYTEGINLDIELSRYLLNGDKNRFNEAIQSYYNFLNKSFTLVDNFKPAESFDIFFGTGIDCSSLNQLKSFTVANLDLNFDNIVFDTSKSTYEIYDCEWIFDFPIPVNYVFWRALYTFSTNRHPGLLSEEELVSIFRGVGIKEEDQATFKSIELAFMTATSHSSSEFHSKYSKKITNIFSLLQNQQAQIQNLASRLSTIYNTKTWKLKVVLYYLFKTFILNSKEMREVRIIAKSKLFDRSYYLSQYPDVISSGVDPIIHYVQYGWKEGRNPNATFYTKNILV